MSKSNDDSNSPLITPIRVGVLLSSLWALIVAFYRFSAGKDGNQLWTFWKSDPNLFGDTLAGVFAPLAFLWLVIATFIQKEELRLQVLELQKTVEHLGDTAKSQRSSQLREDRLEKQSEIKEKIEVVARWITDAADQYCVRFGAPKNPYHYVFGLKVQLAEFVDRRDFDGCLLHASNSAARLEPHYSPPDIVVYCSEVLEGQLASVSEHIYELKELVNVLDLSTWHDKIEAIGVNLLDQQLDEISGIIRKRGRCTLAR